MPAGLAHADVADFMVKSVASDAHLHQCFGMAPRWVEHPRPLVLLLVAIDVDVTLVFKADVEAQGGAYATGVLVLLLSAGVAVALALGREARAASRERRSRMYVETGYYWAVTLVLTFTLVDNVIARYDGVLIAGLFIFAILTASALSRVRRATELRVETLTFTDDASREAWRSLCGKKINLVPVGGKLDPETLRAKVERLRRDYRAEAPIAFVHVELADDTSEFRSVLSARVTREGAYYLMEIPGAVAIPNTLAWVSEALEPIAIYLELSLKTPLRQAIEHLLWGGGEVGILVYEILVRYWHSTPEDDVRPRIFLVSR